MGRTRKEVDQKALRVSINDKGDDNTSAYVYDGFGITFTDYVDEEQSATFMTGFRIAGGGKVYEGNNLQELISTLKDICKEYNLHNYTDRKKDVLVIYTDRLWELSCYLDIYETAEFTYYFQVMDYIEFRECWDDRCTTAEEIAEWARDYIVNLFAPEKYFYLTKSQVFRKRITKTCKKNNITIGNDLIPSSYERFKQVRKALFGGICYCPDPDPKSEPITKPLIEIDIKSAYIYCFLKKHCSTSGEWVDPKTWKNYINNPDKFSIGQYTITYTSWDSLIKCYKNIDGNECNKPRDGRPVSDVFVMNNHDLKMFMDIVNVTKVECSELLDCDVDYLPKEILDCVVQAFLNKENAGDETIKQIMKVILNSIYGNTIRRADTRDEWKRLKRYSYLAPQWGILITSYCKELVLGLGSQLDGWVYSDTDSIFCYDTPENRAKIEAFNNKIRENVKFICDLYDYDFEKLKNLGCFMIEEEIVKFKAWKQKQYVFTRKNPKYDKKTKKWVWMVKKAAGCNRDVLFDDEIYEAEEVPIGEKILHKRFRPHIIEIEENGRKRKEKKTYETTVNGITYKQPTSFYIIKINAPNDVTLKCMELNYELHGELPY